MAKPKFESVREQLVLVHDELLRRQASQTHRLTSIQTMSGLLIGSAAIVAALIGSLGFGGPVKWALFWALVATSCGIIAVFPRAIYELRPSAVRQRLLALDQVDAYLWLIDQHMRHIELREEIIAARFRWMRSGFIALAIVMMLVALGAAGPTIEALLAKGK